MVEVHKTLDIPEAPKKGSKAGIPLPPPPPPAGQMGMEHGPTHLLKAINRNAGKTESPDSSFYSPGRRGLPYMTSLLLHFLCPATHLNRDKIESNLSVTGIQGRHENVSCKTFEISPHMMCL